MMTVALAIALAIAMAGCGRSRTPLPSAPPGFHLIDLMPRYRAFRDSSARAPTGDRVRLFKAMVIEPEARFYREVLGVPTDERLGGYLAAIEPLDAAMTQIGDEWIAALPAAWNELASTFPHLPVGGRIYLLPSLFNSNGQVRYLGDTALVMLGPDVQAYVETTIDSGRRTPPALVIQHELTHYHHWAANPEVGRAAKSFFRPGAYSALYYNLWSEGFATYVTRALNPDASLDQVLGPGVDSANGSMRLPALAREFLDKLESTREDDIRDLFYLSGRRKDLPVRSAYYVGYLVVEALARRHSLPALARLAGPELVVEIRNVLTAIAGR